MARKDREEDKKKPRSFGQELRAEGRDPKQLTEQERRKAVGLPDVRVFSAPTGAPPATAAVREPGTLSGFIETSALPPQEAREVREASARVGLAQIPVQEQRVQQAAAREFVAGAIPQTAEQPQIQVIDRQQQEEEGFFRRQLTPQGEFAERLVRGETTEEERDVEVQNFIKGLKISGAVAATVIPAGKVLLAARGLAGATSPLIATNVLRNGIKAASTSTTKKILTFGGGISAKLAGLYGIGKFVTIPQRTIRSVDTSLGQIREQITAKVQLAQKGVYDDPSEGIQELEELRDMVNNYVLDVKKLETAGELSEVNWKFADSVYIRADKINDFIDVAQQDIGLLATQGQTLSLDEYSLLMEQTRSTLPEESFFEKIF